MSAAARRALKSSPLRRRSSLARVGKKAKRDASGWRRTKRDVAARSGGRCEVVWEDGLRHLHRATDFHHVVKRSQGRDDSPDNVVHIHRQCHDWTDAPFAKGRLVILKLGAGRFAYRPIVAADKAEAEALIAEWWRFLWGIVCLSAMTPLVLTV